MSKLIMWNVITLDGYFEGEKNWELPFHATVWGPELERFSLEQLNDAGGLVFGRVTYEGMAAYWEHAEEEAEVASFMNKLPKIVCSRTLSNAGWNNTILLKENIGQQIAELKVKGEKDLYVFGSANLCETLIAENLIDEYRICIAPVITGKGRYLFPKGLSDMKLKLLSSQPLSSGGIILKYGVL